MGQFSHKNCVGKKLFWNTKLYFRNDQPTTTPRYTTGPASAVNGTSSEPPSDDREYYNDLPGKVPPESEAPPSGPPLVPPPVPPLPDYHSPTGTLSSQSTCSADTVIQASSLSSSSSQSTAISNLDVDTSTQLTSARGKCVPKFFTNNISKLRRNSYISCLERPTNI